MQDTSSVEKWLVEHVVTKQVFMVSCKKNIELNQYRLD